MAAPHSDALVLFGITGDLAKKKLFPAVYHLVESDRLPGDRAGRRRRRRARRGTTRTSGSATPSQRRRGRTRSTRTRSRPSLKRLQLRVAATTASRRPSRTSTGRLEGREHPLFYLAIPPALFDDVVAGARPASGSTRAPGSSSRSRSAATCESAQRAQRGAAQRVPESVDLPHRPLPRQGASREPARVPLRQLDARADLEPQLHHSSPDHDGRGRSASQGRGKFYDTGRRAARRRAEPPAEIVALLAMEPPVDADARRAARREGQGLPPDRRASTRAESCAASTAATSTKPAWSPAPTPRPSSPCASRSTRGAGPACRGSIRAGKAHAGHRDRGGGRVQGAAAAVVRRRRHADARPEPPALPARARRRHHAAAASEGARRRAGHAAGRPRGDATSKVFGARQEAYQRLLEDAMDGDPPPLRSRATALDRAVAHRRPVAGNTADPCTSTTKGTWGPEAEARVAAEWQQLVRTDLLADSSRARGRRGRWRRPPCTRPRRARARRGAAGWP